MGYRESYEEWLNNPYFDEETRKELQAIAGNEKEIEERFYMDLEFGTAGLRGIIGAGTNRMNVYTVRKATQGLANYILGVGAEKKALQLLMIQEECHRNLQMWQHSALLQTESKRMYLNPCGRHRSFPMR